MATRTDDGAGRGTGAGPFAVVEALDRGVYALFAGFVEIRYLRQIITGLV